MSEATQRGAAVPPVPAAPEPALRPSTHGADQCPQQGSVSVRVRLQGACFLATAQRHSGGGDSPAASGNLDMDQGQLSPSSISPLCLLH